MTVGLALEPGVIGGRSVGIGAEVSENIAVSVTSAVGITNGVGEVVPGRVQANVAPTSTRNARRLRCLPVTGWPVMRQMSFPACGYRSALASERSLAFASVQGIRLFAYSHNQD